MTRRRASPSLEAALDGHEKKGQEYLDCANEALDDYVQCVTANDSCDLDTNDVCTSVYSVTVGRCTQLPADVQSAFDACKS